MKSFAVIGKNFGDEGKGLACAGLCSYGGKCLIVKHNGGAQAGHTVENRDGRRFIHHQIGSGAEYGADTLFTDAFHPDLYKLMDEVEEFRTLYGFVPRIFAEPSAEITTIDDVLLNMGAETARGLLRHGSCGMGINECVERGKAGFCLTVEDVKGHDAEWLSEKLKFFRENYSHKRADALSVKAGEYFDMLNDSDILEGYAARIKTGEGLVELVNPSADWLKTYDRVIFENGQGLLLDNDYLKFMPYLSPSKTGLYNPVRFLKTRGLELDEAIYVTRTYVTRHGAGPLPCECSREALPGLENDFTNEPNEWQGIIRYGLHESQEAFCREMLKDFKSNTVKEKTKLSVLLTHLNETANTICFKNGGLTLRELLKVLPNEISKIYVSDDHWSFKHIVK